MSPRGILWFLIGLFISAVFIELVIWGMFRFMARSEALFPQGKQNPMVNAQKAAPAADGPHSVLQNTPAVNLAVFPEPRLQVNDAGEMGRLDGVGTENVEHAATIYGCERKCASADIAGDAVDRAAWIAGAWKCAARC